MARQNKAVGIDLPRSPAGFSGPLELRLKTNLQIYWDAARLAALEGGECGLLFSSGMSAITVMLMARLNSGDEVIFFDECYHRSREYCTKHLSRFGVVTRQVTTGDYSAMENAINRNTRLLISESPTNPHLSIVDLDRFAEIGRRNHIDTLIDATLATPFNVRPIDFGVDYVLHSATKYLGGHNDLLAGVVAGSNEKLAEVRKLRGILGSINSAHNIYLLERGLKTLELRMQRHNDNGLRVDEYCRGIIRSPRSGQCDDGLFARFYVQHNFG